MNICIITPGYPYKSIVSFEFVRKIVNEWARSGHYCVVISPQSITTQLKGKEKRVPCYYEEEVDEGKLVHVFRPKYISLGWNTYWGYSPSLFTGRRAIEKCLSKQNVKFDIIYCHFFSSAFMGWRYSVKKNIPMFVAGGESSISNIGAPCLGFSYSKFSQSVRGYVFVSNKCYKEARNLGLINSDNYIIQPNGTNLSVFKKLNKTDCRKKLGLPNDAFMVISVGAIIERKGQTRVYNAVKRLNDSYNTDIKMLFVGKGNLGIEDKDILFVGQVVNDKLPLYLNAADVFVLPTLNEGCCNAIVEAMACGLPIISSDRSFNHDILSQNNSILVDPENVDEISDAIYKLYGNPQLMKELSDNSYKKAQNLSINQRASAILSFIMKK